MSFAPAGSLTPRRPTKAGGCNEKGHREHATFGEWRLLGDGNVPTALRLVDSKTTAND